MSKKPLISVIIPVYNVGESLSACLDSVLRQSIDNYEIICVDDGSSDFSGDVLDKYARNNPKLKIIHQKNGGVSSARNKALAEALGKYIYFMDSDDLAHPQILEILSYNMDKYQVPLVCCNYHKISENINPEMSVIEDFDGQLIANPFDEFLNKEGILSYNLWTKMYEREFVGSQLFDVSLNYGEDLYFNLEYINKINQAVYVDKKLYFYVQRDSSCTNSSFTKKKADSFVNLVENIYLKFYENCKFEKIRKNISNLSMKFLIKKLEDIKEASLLYSRIFLLYKLGAFTKQGFSFKKSLILRKILNYQVKTRTLCHLHIYYLDQLDYFSKKLKKIDFDEKNLYITTDEIQKSEKIRKYFPQAKIFITENVGYDVYPFLYVMKNVDLSVFDNVIHLHTKNTQRCLKWRNNLVEALVGNKSIYENNRRIMESENCGLLGSVRCLVKIQDTAPESTVYLDEIMKEQGIIVDKNNRYSFYGTMFMMKTEVLKQMLALPYERDDFVEKKYETATLAHVYERLFGIFTLFSGKDIVGVESRMFKNSKLIKGAEK